MGNMDGQACPNVAVQPGSECVWRCRCSVEYCWRLMGGGGHIVSAPTKQEGASQASVDMQGLCDLAQCAWCRLGGGWTQSSTQTFQRCTKHPWGPVWRCACVGGQYGGWFSGSWSKLGVWKKCCGLNKILPMPMLILLLPNKQHAYVRTYRCGDPGWSGAYGWGGPKRKFRRGM